MNKKTKILFLAILSMLVLSLLGELIRATPTGPQITYISNSTLNISGAVRNQDAKGTITVANLASNQQSFKWKAYVGNVTGALVLDDANAKSIYDWTLATVVGEIYATRSSNTISWSGVICSNQTVINTEETGLGMASTMTDSINNTFRNFTHRSFLLGINNISSDTCRSTATYVNSTAQVVSDTAFFQEVLLMDPTNGAMVYTTFIEDNHLAYSGTSTYDFQMLVAENESSNIPQTYYFYLELG